MVQILQSGPGLNPPRAGASMDPKTIVELHSLTRGARVGKAFHRKADQPGWHKSGAGCDTTHWRAILHGGVMSLEDLERVLRQIAAREGNGSVVVLDAPIEGVSRRRMRRLGSAEMVERGTATLAQRDVQFVMLDVDDLDAREVGVDAEALASAVAEGGEVARRALRDAESRVAAHVFPEAWQGCGFVANWSGSAGVAGWGKLKIHLWVMLEAPACRDSLKRVFGARELAGYPAVDTALWRPVQIHHVANPHFAGGSDPLSGLRWSLHPGTAAALDLGGEYVLEDLATHTARVIREEEEVAAAYARELEQYKRQQKKRGGRGGADANLCRKSAMKAAESALVNALDAISGAQPGNRHALVTRWCKTVGGWVDACVEDDGGLMQPLGAYGPDVLDQLIRAGEIAYGGAGAARKANLHKTARGAFEVGRRAPFTRTVADVAVMLSKDARSSAERAARYRQRAQVLKAADPEPHLSHVPSALRAIGIHGGAVVVPRGRFYAVEDVQHKGARRLYLRGAHGTGKTTIMEKLVAAAKAAGRPIVYVAPRQALIDDTTRRLGLADYRDITGPISLGKHACVAICLDSLCRLRWDHDSKPALLLLDESDQLARHMYGETIRNSAHTTSLRVYRQLRRLISMSDLTVAADADLSGATLEMCRGEAGQPDDCREEVAVVHPYQHALLMRMYAHRSDLRMRLWHFMEAKKPGRTIAVVSTTAAETDRLAYEYREAGYEVLCINRVTAQIDPEVKDFLADPSSAEGKYDLIISSPTLGTGFSIDWQVDRLFLFAAHVSGFTAEDAVQMGWRYRDVRSGRWDAWVQRRVDTLPTTREAVDARGRATEALALRAGARANVKRRSLPACSHDAAHWSLFCTIEAAKNRSCADVHKCLLEIAAERGWAVEDAPEASPEERKADSKLAKEIRERVRQKLIDATHAADRIDYEERAALKSDGIMCERDRWRLARADVAFSLSVDEDEGHDLVSEQRIEEYLQGHGRKGRKAALHRVIMTAGSKSSDDQEGSLACIGGMLGAAFKRGTFETREGVGREVANALTRAKLLNVAKIDPLNPDQWLDGSRGITDEVKRLGWSQKLLEERGLVDWIEQNRLRVNCVVSLRSDWKENLCWIVGEVLSAMGFSRFRHQYTAEGKRWSLYHLDRAGMARARVWAEAPFCRFVEAGRRSLDERELADAQDPLLAAQTSAHRQIEARPVQALPSEERVRAAAAVVAVEHPWGAPSLADLTEGVAALLGCAEDLVARVFAGMRADDESHEALIERVALAA